MTEFQNDTGEVFYRSEYNADEGWVTSSWFGSVTFEQVQQGGNDMLQKIEEHKSLSVLNDNRDLAGNWSDANDWIESEFMPKAEELGLKYIAHVFSPNFITKFSAVDLGVRKLPVEFKTFGDMEEAKNWLRERMTH